MVLFSWPRTCYCKMIVTSTWVQNCLIMVPSNKFDSRIRPRVTVIGGDSNPFTDPCIRAILQLCQPCCQRKEQILVCCKLIWLIFIFGRGYEKVLHRLHIHHWFDWRLLLQPWGLNKSNENHNGMYYLQKEGNWILAINIPLSWLLGHLML